MNEKEAILYLEHTVEDDFNLEEHQRHNRYLAIKTILELYNKEKEKREIAEENHKVLSLDLGRALKELGLYEDTIIADELVLEINKKYISKDKIKEKIEFYKRYGKIKNSDEYVMSVEIEVLEELLEG